VVLVAAAVLSLRYLRDFPTEPEPERGGAPMSQASPGLFLDIHGAQLYSEEHGAGAPLVLIHDGLGSGVE
jgi:hypothetical protein